MSPQAAASPAPEYHPTRPSLERELHPSGYLVEIRPHECACGNTWTHSVFWLVETVAGNLTTVFGGHRRVKPRAGPLMPLPIGHTKLPLAHTYVCGECMDNPQVPILDKFPELLPTKFAQAVEKARQLVEAPPERKARPAAIRTPTPDADII